MYTAPCVVSFPDLLPRPLYAASLPGYLVSEDIAAIPPHTPNDALSSLHPTSLDNAVELTEGTTQHSEHMTTPTDNDAPLGSPQGAQQDDLQGQDDSVMYFSDSGFDSGSLLGDETLSLASSIMQYRMENGRQYHAYRDGAYWGPNDELAKEILDFAHHMYLLTLNGKLHVAPVRNPQMILDVGTGTGIWAVDVADLYHSATVIGTDLSPIQPEWVPPNCHFEIDDVTSEWTFPPEHFDFIHIRELFGCIPDWDFFFQQAYEHMRPGGWIEIVEHSVQPISDDGSVDENHFFTMWGQTVIQMGELWGKSFTIWSEAKERLEKAGFVDVVEVPYKWPMNGWPKGDKKLKDIGRWNQLRLHEGVEGFMLRLLTQVGGWHVDRAQVFLGEMRATLRDYKTHAYLPGTVVYGRKPLTS